MLNIEEPYTHKYAFLQLAFRPFFAAAMIFSAIFIGIWAWLYHTGSSLPNVNYNTTTWHAHEMIFGYIMAVVGGFLLTAIKNWTNIQTLQKTPLLLLLLLWLGARAMPFIEGEQSLLITAIFDISFLLYLFIAAVRPVIRAKQWNQVGIISKILLIALFNTAFYYGLITADPLWERIGLYGAFYMILALVLTMIRRLVPFFTEKGVDGDFEAKNYRWVDITSLVAFLLFAIADIINPMSQIVAVLAIIQFALHSFRVYNWYHPGIWKKPLLWSIASAYAWITLGFLLKALSVWTDISLFVALHSFTYGGLGMITLGMMTRVALGHTGRSVFQPPKILNLVFIVLSTGSVVRILLPLFMPQSYALWIGISQALWIAAFSIIAVVYVPMLLKARVDRRPG